MVFRNVTYHQQVDLNTFTNVTEEIERMSGIRDIKLKKYACLCLMELKLAHECGNVVDKLTRASFN